MHTKGSLLEEGSNTVPKTQTLLGVNVKAVCRCVFSLRSPPPLDLTR